MHFLETYTDRYLSNRRNAVKNHYHVRTSRLLTEKFNVNGFGNGNLWCMVVSHVAEDLRNAATKKFWSTILRNDAVDPNVFNDFIRHEEWWTYDLFAPAAALRLDVPDFCAHWMLLHFVLAQSCWRSRNSVFGEASGTTTQLQSAEEWLIRSAFR